MVLALTIVPEVYAKIREAAINRNYIVKSSAWTSFTMARFIVVKDYIW